VYIAGKITKLQTDYAIVNTTNEKVEIDESAFKVTEFEARTSTVLGATIKTTLGWC